MFLSLQLYYYVLAYSKRNVGFTVSPFMCLSKSPKICNSHPPLINFEIAIVFHETLIFLQCLHLYISVIVSSGFEGIY